MGYDFVDRHDPALELFIIAVDLGLSGADLLFHESGGDFDVSECLDHFELLLEFLGTVDDELGHGPTTQPLGYLKPKS